MKRLITLYRPLLNFLLMALMLLMVSACGDSNSSPHQTSTMSTPILTVTTSI